MAKINKQSFDKFIFIISVFPIILFACFSTLLATECVYEDRIGIELYNYFIESVEWSEMLQENEILDANGNYIEFEENIYLNRLTGCSISLQCV